MHTEKWFKVLLTLEKFFQFFIKVALGMGTNDRLSDFSVFKEDEGWDIPDPKFSRCLAVPIYIHTGNFYLAFILFC